MVTWVTGLWDIGRGNLSPGWSRTYDYYLQKFVQLLAAPHRLIIFGDKELKEFVYQYRDENITQFIERPLSWFENEFYPQIQQIRQDPAWINQVSWLKNSPQASLSHYNPIVLAKPFLLNDAAILDKFNSTHLYWIDAGITNTVSPTYLTNSSILESLQVPVINFCAFPYNPDQEIHGFAYTNLQALTKTPVDKVCRGGFFGGPKSEIASFNARYYQLLKSTLNQNLMGTEESLFTILLYQYPAEYGYYLINADGLLYTFFEHLKKSTHKLHKLLQVGLYILTFNSPAQVELLISSMLQYDANLITKPCLFLLDNSTDDSTQIAYQTICNKHHITHIKQNNLGICGGRQFIAEHAEAHNFDYYLFFEDDMLFYTGSVGQCRNGFSRVVCNIYNNLLAIMEKNHYDFLKLSFAEFYGDNKTQWAWYNVPQSFREVHWPQNPTLPVFGQDPFAPLTKFNHIQTLNSIPYIDGEVYYCNWPQIVSRAGNRKMFLTTKWQHPYEQTWMSHMYQESLKGHIRGAVLLASPIEHQRIHFYPAEIRKES